MAARRRAYREWARTGTWHVQGPVPFGLGEVQFVLPEDRRGEGGVTVANLCGQHGLRSRANPCPIRYEALAQVRDYALLTGYGVMPRV